MVSFWEVIDRALNKGELCSSDKFDMRVFTVITDLVKKYGIRYNPKEPVGDGDTADRVFQAGVEAYTQLGTYCYDTGRIIKFSKEEIAEALDTCSRCPSEIEIGSGTEKRTLFKRQPYDARPPLSLCAFIESNPPEGRVFVQMYKSVIQETTIDGFYYGPSPHKCEGRTWTMGTPFEVHSARNAHSWVREALRAYGRNGMHLIDANPSAIGLGAVMAGGPEVGLRKTDAVALPLASELKVEIKELNKTALTLEYGCIRNPYWAPIVGGFAGGPEGAAVASVASALNAILVFRVAGHGYVTPSGIIMHPAVASARPALWVRNMAIQALNRNTNLITCPPGSVTAAGPGTSQQLWEIAALGLVISAGGGHPAHGVRKSVLVKPAQGSGLEPRWQAEVAKAAAGLDRDTINMLVNFALSKYEETLHNNTSPEGYSFWDLYDVELVEIKPHYWDLYCSVKEELRNAGLKGLK